MFKLPEDDLKYQWTNHVKDKMVYYGISESLIKRIVKFPKRVEGGVAPKTVAVMQPGSNKKKPTEIWVMYQSVGGGLTDKSSPSIGGLKNKFDITIEKKKIISAWRYPGISPVGKKIPIPDEILQELESII